MLRTKPPLYTHMSMVNYITYKINATKNIIYTSKSVCTNLLTDIRQGLEISFTV